MIFTKNGIIALLHISKNNNNNKLYAMLVIRYEEGWPRGANVRGGRSWIHFVEALTKCHLCFPFIEEEKTKTF